MEQTVILIFLGIMICWLLWEIHQKLHKMHEQNLQSFRAFESILNQLVRDLKNRS
jgi:hypothetical protein